MESGRQIRGTVLLAEIAAAERLGLLPEVRRCASAALRELLDHPPLAMTQLPGELMDDLHSAVTEAGGGPDALVQVMLESLRAQLGPLLRPLFDSTRVLYGSGPQAFLANLGTIAKPLVSGFAFTWEADGPRSGVVTVHPDSRPRPGTFAVWEAVITYLVEIAGEKASVARALLGAAGRSATIRVSW